MKAEGRADKERLLPSAFCLYPTFAGMNGLGGIVGTIAG